MPKIKKILTTAQIRARRQAKRERKKNFERIFVHGKQKWVKRPPTIDGLTVDEYIRRNADPIWLQQNEMWEYIDSDPTIEFSPKEVDPLDLQENKIKEKVDYDEDIPF